MGQSNPIFKQNYMVYLGKLDAIDYGRLPSILDVAVDEDRRIARIPFFQTNYNVSVAGVVDDDGNRAGYNTCVILLKYLLMCPNHVPREKDWVNYRDLKNSGYSQHSSLADYAVESIAKYYAGQKSRLKGAIQALNGKPPEKDYPYDISAVFTVLPRVPILFLYNDAEEHFPARAFILFERRVEHFLDAECLAMIGSSLLVHLRQTESGCL